MTGESSLNGTTQCISLMRLRQEKARMYTFVAWEPGGFCSDLLMQLFSSTRTVEKGKGILPVFETPVGRVGLLICFDLRFPEISLALRRQDAQIISYASAFLAQTGPAHWETLLRARAIETQCYIIAAAQAGQHNKGRASYGHAMIVNPWGEVVAKLGEEPKEPQIATAEIDFDFFSRVRTKMRCCGDTTVCIPSSLAALPELEEIARTSMPLMCPFFRFRLPPFFKLNSVPSPLDRTSSMARFGQQIILPGAEFPLETAVALLDYYSKADYYVYERDDIWYLGLGAHASLVVDPKGQTATEIDSEGRKESSTILNLLTGQVRQFVSKYSIHGKIFGQVGFNYSARCSGAGLCPKLRSQATLKMMPMKQAERIKGILKSISLDNIYLPSDPGGAIDLTVDAGEYQARVANAIAEIAKGRYTKAIPSRKVPLDFRADMLATLLHGRRANTPARTFSLNHMGMQATGFSPEVLLSIEDGNVYTEALAGTQLSESPEASLDPFDNKLHNDAKEVMEHVIAIKGSSRRLSPVCLPESIAFKDFMKVMPRGSVQHLFSHVRGRLRADCDGWDALPGLIANITVPGMPGPRNLEAIRCFEPEPRDLYCGAVLMLDECSKLFEATLVLRTVFQDAHRQWLQAGAGVTSYSKPEREFAETCEKLESVAPFVIPQRDSLGLKSRVRRAHLRSQRC
ncbi:hypothetical protein KXW35_006757 [Aspergillus fumigatus]|nr:hypothetical protein KXX45_007197 [Aspergillus fumigatus]KAH1292965.1 hypothetical protein KXX48_005810 [Aspergillus fumigatus]KAH1571723.1 hypothetical protein KXX28_006933 [Aspergillus fumigatus]KAH1696737.1 hypothetical protein KXX12_006689 [Aspergillus fumigatus]KAH1829163.1 hypothetical protein KXX27_006946 [Aspergillus fumigatus]